jgi:Ty3 transposon capsid-like protein
LDNIDTDDEEGPVKNNLKEEPKITEETRTMAAPQENDSFEIPNITRPTTPRRPTPIGFEQPYQQFPPTMNPFTSPPRRETPKEKNFNKPTPFHGDRKKIETFIQECRMYLHANRTIYTDDEDKIMFMLSYMTDKEALRWKQTYLRSVTSIYGDMTFPTLRAFVEDLNSYFRPANTQQDAAHKLTILRQGKMTAEEVITEFRLLSSHAGYTAETTSDHMHLIEKLRKILNPSLAKKIMLDYNPPTTIDGWINRAILLDTQYRQTMEIINDGKNDGKAKNDKKTTKSGWTNYFDKSNKKERDPDAMDIDRLSPEKRSFLMKKGACFRCEKPGHLAKEHDEYERKEKEKKKTSARRTEASTSTSTTTESKTPAKSTTNKRDMTKLHALLQALSTEEQEELLALQSAVKGKEKDEGDDESEEDF